MMGAGWWTPDVEDTPAHCRLSRRRRILTGLAVQNKWGRRIMPESPDVAVQTALPKLASAAGEPPWARPVRRRDAPLEAPAACQSGPRDSRNRPRRPVEGPYSRLEARRSPRRSSVAPRSRPTRPNRRGIRQGGDSVLDARALPGRGSAGIHMESLLVLISSRSPDYSACGQSHTQGKHDCERQEDRGHHGWARFWGWVEFG
jgi:hypothetical protein